MRRLAWTAVFVLIAASLITTVAVAKRSPGKSQPAPFKQATLIVETNATDGDAGLQISLDHEPWRSIAIDGPDGRRLLDITTRGVLQDYGLTELFSESSEPPFTKFPLERFKNLFPAGRYTFVGQTIGGATFQSSVVLTHNIPAGPVISSPAQGSTVSRDDAVVRWEPVTEPAGIDIVGYQVLVTREGPLRVFSADLPGGATSLHIPAEFLESGVGYKVEVLAIERGRNQTLTEVAFTTR
ncbi:MAG: hypothetical protein ACRDJ4_05025 [Actinomycetota bacterium]